MRLAGALAGLHVERILNEPTAAALAYAFGRHLNQRVLVYDLGGGTFDASVLELNDNVYEVVSTGGDTFLGGVDFDNRIVDRLLAVWKEQTGRRRSPATGWRSRASWTRRSAPSARSRSGPTSAIHLPFLALKDGQPVSLETHLDPRRGRRPGRAARGPDARGLPRGAAREGAHRRRTSTRCCSSAASRACRSSTRRSPRSSARRPRAPSTPTRRSRSARRSSPTRSGAPRASSSSTCSRCRSGSALPGGRVKTIIERNTPLPARKQYGLATTKDGQTEFELVVYQGESRHRFGVRLPRDAPAHRAAAGPARDGEDRGHVRARAGVPPHRDGARAQHRPAGAGGDVHEGGPERRPAEARAGGQDREGADRLVPGPRAAPRRALPAAGAPGPRRRGPAGSRRVLPAAVRATTRRGRSCRLRRPPRAGPSPARCGRRAARGAARLEPADRERRRAPPRRRAGCSG